MEFFTDKKVAHKIIIALVIVILFNFVSPRITFAAEGDGVLLNPILHFITIICDAIMNLLNKTIIGNEAIITIPKTGFWSKVGRVFTVLGGVVLMVGGMLLVIFGPKATGAALTAKGAGITLSGLAIAAAWSLATVAGAGVAIAGATITMKGFETDEIKIPTFWLTPEEIFLGLVPMLDVNFISPRTYNKKGTTQKFAEEAGYVVPQSDFNYLGLKQFDEHGTLLSYVVTRQEFKETATSELELAKKYGYNKEEEHGWLPNKYNYTYLWSDTKTSSLETNNSSLVYYWLGFNFYGEDKYEGVIETYTQFDYYINEKLKKADINKNDCEKYISEDGLIRNYSNENGFLTVVLDSSPQSPNSWSSVYDAAKVEFKYQPSISTPALEIQGTISSWYIALRNLALVILLSVLIYIGIRIVISSAAGEKAKYKQRLLDWVIAMCLLFSLHYIMAIANFLVDSINGMFIGTVSTVDVVIEKPVSPGEYDIDEVFDAYIAEGGDPEFYNDLRNRLKHSYQR